MARPPLLVRMGAMALLVISMPVTGTDRAKDHEWPYYGGDAGGKKYSTLTDINPANVAALTLAWQWRTGEVPLPQYATSPGMFEATPLMIDGCCT